MGQVHKETYTKPVSRYAISQATGVSESALSRFVNGESDLKLETLDRIADVIGVKLTVARPKRRKD